MNNKLYYDQMIFLIFSRHGQSQWLLYQYLRHLLILSLSKSFTSSPGFTAPPSPNGLRLCFQSYVAQVKGILNPKRILPIGGVESRQICACSLHSRLEYMTHLRSRLILNILWLEMYHCHLDHY